MSRITAARVEQGAQIQAQAGLRRHGRAHAHAAGNRGRVQSAGQIRRAGKQRRRMTIIAHAEYHGIERTGHSRKCLPRRYRAHVRGGGAVFQAVKSSGGRRAPAAARRAPASRCCPGSAGSTQRSSASAMHTRLQSSVSARSSSNSFTGDLPPDTTRLASPRAAMAGREARGDLLPPGRATASRRRGISWPAGSEFVMPGKSVAAQHARWRRPDPRCRRCRFSALRQIVASRRGSGRSMPRRRRVRRCA